MESVTEVRSALIEFVRADLVGPAHGADEVLEDAPYVKYAAGVLFPRTSLVDESGSIGGVEANEHESDGTALDEESGVSDSVSQGVPTIDPHAVDENDADTYDDSVTLANSYKPSAIALTFALPTLARKLQVKIRAAVYESETRTSADGRRIDQIWRRQEITLDDIQVLLPEAGIHHYTVYDGLKFCAFVGNRRGRRIVTASLYNHTTRDSRNAKTFYQSGFELNCVDPICEFVEYSDFEHTVSLDDEELALEMMYRDRKSFAIGHGCAADWTDGENGGARSLRTESVPRVVVPPVEPRTGKDRYLSMRFLQGASADSDKDMCTELYALCTDYKNWITAKTFASKEIPERYEGVARRNLELCRIALDRIRRGIECLESDSTAVEAFKLANRAILMQQHHSRLPIRSLDADPAFLPPWDDYPSGYWRTFQLAFVLMTIPGIVDATDSIRLDDEEQSTRDLVDLIWFPTGGGKTEAYLAISAFLIFLTRLRDPAAKGCEVLMRYTLRLLTSQQFQRASSLICACELIRLSDSDRLGSERITIGLWVGRSLTPNDEKFAARAVTKLSTKTNEGKNPFQLLSCPWCGTTMTDKSKLGYVIFKARQRFVCPNSGHGKSQCPFSSVTNALPVCVVDESIYARPPTLLIGTVDKFAILAWKQRAGDIFQVGGGPDLIIQDELHLISGPLGSMVGLYESVIDYLCSNGQRPKIVASTATIRRAREQCMGLYARPMFQFPPAGLDASDSFFARENADSPGRLYAGFLPAAASSGLSAQIRSVVALLQGIHLIHRGTLRDEWIDPYFTLVQYFSSLKELGRAATFVRADIPEFLPTMHRSYGLSKDDDPDRRRFLHTSEELTSRRNEEEIPKILMRLEKAYDPDGRYDSQALDTVLATNMISVGVDIDRLGLMMVVTQPKGTSEYIQASSRVGRSSKSPGLVLMLYNIGRPRDRSHYEQFRPYHDAFYRHVEPTSVTPFSPPALERALHAVLVIAGRHIAGWISPSLNRKDPRFGAFLSFLAERVRLVDPDHSQEFEKILDRRLREWWQCGAEKWGDITGAGDSLGLMRPAGRPSDDAASKQWEVPTSMRNVDIDCGAIVVRYPDIRSG